MDKFTVSYLSLKLLRLALSCGLDCILQNSSVVLNWPKGRNSERTGMSLDYLMFYQLGLIDLTGNCFR